MANGLRQPGQTGAGGDSGYEEEPGGELRAIDG